MSKKSRISVIIFAAAIFGFGQAAADMTLNFDRDNQTYNWITGISYSLYDPSFQFKTSFDGQSNLIKGNIDRWQENATADFSSELLAHRGISFLTSGEYTVNGLDRRRVRSSELAMGFSFKPFDHLDLRPMVHADNKKRSELEAQLDDQGVGYGIDARLLPFQFNNANIDARVVYDKTNLTNIPSETGEGYLHSLYNLRETDTIYVSLRGLESAKMFYGTSGKASSITKQIKQEREGNFIVSASLPAGMRLKFDSNANLARYLYRGEMLGDPTAAQRDNSANGKGYEITLSGDFRDFASGNIKYLWSNASQDYQGRILDQDTDTGEITFHGSLRLSQYDSLGGDLVLGVTSFSNPNTGYSQEDRDKSTALINGGYRHIFSDFFSAGVTGGVNNFHQVYISGARSANNGRNDTYIVTPLVFWRPYGWIEVNQEFDIQANYITFDFDRKKVATKNRIFRRASSRTSFNIRISGNLRLRQAYIYRYEDYGQLIWDDGWQQAVSWDRRRNGLETELLYDIMGIAQFKPYFFWEKTGDYDHRTVNLVDPLAEPSVIRDLTEEQVKMIFRAEIVFQWSGSRRLMANIAHRLRKFNDRPREINNYMRVSMEYAF